MLHQRPVRVRSQFVLNMSLRNDAVEELKNLNLSKFLRQSFWANLKRWSAFFESFRVRANINHVDQLFLTIWNALRKMCHNELLLCLMSVVEETLLLEIAMHETLERTDNAILSRNKKKLSPSILHSDRPNLLSLISRRLLCQIQVLRCTQLLIFEALPIDLSTA